MNSKFNNIHFMTLIMLSDYMKALNSTRNLPTNNEHFPMHILFSIIYSLQEQELNPRNHSEHKIIMRYCV
jgi:hypothetical protein